MKKKWAAIFTVFFLAFVLNIDSGIASEIKPIKWRGQSTWPSGLPILQEAAIHFSERVRELSGGRLLIDMGPAGTIVPSNELLDAVNSGLIDISCAWAGYWRGQFPTAPLFASVACGPEVSEFLGWVMAGGGLELWQEMYDRKNYNVKVLPPYSAHRSEDLAWSKKPIRTLDDFKGLRFRAGGFYWGKVLQKLGASVVTLPGSEVIPSLERGVIDAGEFSMPAIDLNMGFHEVCKYLIIPGIHQPSSIDETLVNKDSWDKLPKDLQEIVWTAAVESSLYIMNLEMKLNPSALKKFEESGVEIITLSPDVMSGAKKIADQVYYEAAEKDPFFKKVLDSQKEFINNWDYYKAKNLIKYN